MQSPSDKQDEVHFLAEEFDIAPVKAAALVTEDEDEALQLAAHEHQRTEDPFGENPVPISPEERHVPGDGGMQKSVLRRRNDRGRAGP
ncbi:hypothetical protein [Devosia sediminis]|uniref:Uncharacterized protein n=1 Tax=Devosia sediminis TaxID=2798801 RepID=A0A934IVA6_9HYPH|nr:hypothetical protein [Devosia sediminis]MBJ3783746.1 hypothetical protein [Devosia sediminis]